MKKLNMCTILMYKSNRKNAETSDIINILSVCSTDNLVNFIYSMYCMLYPENKLSYNTLYDNSSIKCHINKYYSEKESKGNEQDNI